MTTFIEYKKLPEPIRAALTELETFIGDCDGRDTVIQTDEDTCIDNGTIDAEDAVVAFNTIVTDIERLTEEVDNLREAIKNRTVKP